MMRSTTTPQNKPNIPGFVRRMAVGAGVLVFWLAVWQGISMLVAQELLVPAPLVVARALGRLAGTAAFWTAAGRSLLRVMEGFLLAVAAGCLLSVMTTRFRAAKALLSPLLHIVRAAPVASFIILALVWIKTNTLPVFIAFLMVVPVVWGNVEKGIRATDPQLLEMARTYRFSPLKTLRRVWIPSVMPYFMAACTTGLGFAWKSGIAAEVICRPAQSIGKYLQDAKLTLETPDVFAWTITVVTLSLLLEKLLVAAARRFGRRYGAETGR